MVAAFGGFHFCRFYIPALNIYINFRPGDVLLLRGRILLHGTTGIAGIRRASLVGFFDEDIFGAVGVEPPTPSPLQTVDPLRPHPVEIIGESDLTHIQIRPDRENLFARQLFGTQAE